MGRDSDLWTFTDYPMPLAPGAANAGTTFHEELLDDFRTMGAASTNAATFGYAAAPRPIFIQEIGYPSSSSNDTVPDLLPQQIAFVGTAFDAWDEYNASVGISEWDWWRNTEGTSTPANSPWSLPRIVGMNWFALHDFNNFITHTCLFGDGTKAPWATACSWGLKYANGRDKALPDGTSSWGTYVARARMATPAALVPNRSCL